MIHPFLYSTLTSKFISLGTWYVTSLFPLKQSKIFNLQAKTSIQKGTTSPIWNEQVVFTEMFPPLVRRMKFQLRDNDAVGSPVIATHYLDLGGISDEGRRGNKF